MPTPFFLTKPLEVTGAFGGSGIVESAASDNNGNLYILDSGGNFYGLRMDSGGFLLSEKVTTLSLSLPRAHCILVGLGSAIVASGSNAQGGSLVELSSFYNTTFAAWSTQLRNASTAKHQQICFNVAASAACMVPNTGGSLGFYNAVTSTAVVSSISGYSADTFNCVIPLGSSSHFLAGSASGHVVEVDSSGHIVSSLFIQPPASSCVVSAVGSSILTSYPVVSLASYNDNVLISTAAGLTYNYLWSSKTQVEVLGMGICGDGLVSGGVAFNNYPDHNTTGMVWYTKFGTTGANNNTYLNVAQITPRGKFRRLSSIRLCAPAPTTSIGYDTSLAGLWVTRSTSNNKLFEIFRTPTYSTTTVPTRVQNPPGTDVSARIIRICDPGVGRAFVYSDGSIGAGQQTLPANGGAEYYEISTIVSGGNTLWDWRKFNC